MVEKQAVNANPSSAAGVPSRSDTRLRTAGLAVAALVLLVVVPFVGSDYLLSLINLAAIAAISAIGLNILTGYTGLISLGHSAFMGVGGYTAAYLVAKLNVPFPLALIAAGLAAGMVGTIFGAPSLRLRGLYLVMATLASQVLLEFLFKYAKPITGGVSGMYVSRPTIFGFALDTERQFYVLVILALAGAAWSSRNLFRTRVGRAFVAIRDRDLAAEIIGVDTARYKLFSFFISSVYAGVAGALWVFYMTIASPESFTLGASIQYVAMIIIGGLGTASGAIWGALFVTLLPQGLERIINLSGGLLPMGQIFAPLRDVLFGLLIILFLLFQPKGLAELFRRLMPKRK